MSANGLAFRDVALLVASPGPAAEMPGIDVIDPVDAGPMYRSPHGRAAGGRVLPYHPRSAYDRKPERRNTRVAVLENEYLRATFLLEFGGRLWSLIDRTAGRELLHQADPLLPANLALRNAWFAGGVEWNLGTRGHWPLTFDAVHASQVTGVTDVAVLRMWEFERMLRVTWRVDAWLPSGSRTLFVRPVVHNPTADVVHVYWWSNVAVPLRDKSRVLVPAVRALHFGYEGRPAEVPVPSRADMSYPAAAGDAADYFFDLDDATRPWIAAVDADGYGLAQASTARLRGRKLFVWGTSRGGEHWQEWLSGDGRYFEIQGGLAKTQYEQLGLPSGASFSWTEAYGPVKLDPAAAHCTEWSLAVAAAQRAVDQLTDADLAEQRASSWENLPPAEPPATVGAGWGALEVRAGHRTPSPATPYFDDTIGAEQQPWLELAARGKLPARMPPAATISGIEWRRKLSGNCSSWHDWLQLALLELAAGPARPAIAALERSLAATPNPWAHRHLAVLSDQASERARAIQHAVLGLQLGAASTQLVVDLLRVLARHERFEEMLTAIDRLDEPVRKAARVRFYECVAAVGTGALERASGLLRSGLFLPDIREGEDSLDELWQSYQDAIGGTDPLPRMYDFRMHCGSGKPR